MIMMSTALVALVLATFGALHVFGADLHVVRFDTSSTRKYEELIHGGFDVRGQFGGAYIMVLGEGHANIPSVIRAMGASCDTLKSLAHGEQVMILEPLVGANMEKWRKDVSACNVEGVQIFVLETAAVLIYEETTENQANMCVPKDTIRVVMPSIPVSIPAHFTPSNVTNGVADDIVSDFIKLISRQSLTEFLIAITNIHTRQSLSTGAKEAATYIESSFRKYGLNVTRGTFRSGYSDNIIGEIRGQSDPNKIVIVGAHYDCRSENINSVTDRAPGANDDGSGTAMLLELARLLGMNHARLRIPYTIRLAAFSGEEQGLYGSTAYANALKSVNADIVAMLQGDMIGYQTGAAPKLELGSRSTTPSLTSQVEAISLKYVPTLPVGRTTGCCSDQQPFWNNGYAAALYAEEGGFTIDPQYHKVGDVINRPGYSIELIELVAQSILASTLILAQTPL